MQKNQNKEAVTGEEIRQAKKFLQNKKMPLTLFKPRLFAAASKEINNNYEKTFNNLINVYKATNKIYRRKRYEQDSSSRSDTTRNKKI